MVGADTDHGQVLSIQDIQLFLWHIGCQGDTRIRGYDGIFPWQEAATSAVISAYFPWQEVVEVVAVVEG